MCAEKKKVADVEIFHINQLAAKIEELDIKMMVLAFPAEGVQQVVDECIAHGVRTFLNFVPAPLKVPVGVKVQTSDVTLDLQSLVYYT
jgi:redox-sensing transcriptional repressor